MPSRRRLRKVAFWGMAVLAASLSGGLWFAYVYITDSDTIARVVRAGLPRYLPGSLVELARARVRPFVGEVSLTQVTLRQVLDGTPFLTARVPWLSVRHDPRAMLEGRFEPSEVVATHPTLRLRRRKDGSWNLQGLLASPWPGPLMKTPPIIIQNGTVELAGDDELQTPAVAILRDVAVKIESAGPGRLAFEGSAKGDTFDRLSVHGTVDITTGRVEFAGDVARLTIAEPLRGRIPAEFRPLVQRLGLTGGEIDLRINRIAYDPAADVEIRYDVAGHLHAGVLACPKMPFPLNDLTAGFAVRDGVVTLDRAEGYYGTTTVRVERGVFTVGDPERAPLDLAVEIIDLELDQKLRDWTPERFQNLWEEFRPSGRLSVAAHLVREREGDPLRPTVTVDCRDVAMVYKYFAYPLDHVSGRFLWEPDRVEVLGLSTLVGGRPLTAKGTIEHPGDRALVRLAFEGHSLPVDKTLLDALPDDVREVVDQFQPTGTVRGNLSLLRTPPESPNHDPRGKVAIDAWIDLNDRCGMRWANLPYPVNNLTGRLELHPDVWEFKNMRGSNGQAVITASGRVEKLPGPGQQLKVDLHLNAEKLPFDDQLRASLPEAWRKSWAILDPTGSSDVDATIKVRPGAPDSYVLVVTPRPATSVRLRYSREAKPGIDPGGTFELPMEHVTGRFVFNNGPVDMQDVGFRFHDSPVQFARGRVIVEDSGKFQLGVSDLHVKDIRLDSRLRAIMPPVMAQFAERLDNGKTFTSKGNLALGWSGAAGVPVWCRWDKTLVIFNDNAVQIQPELALEHVQGQIDNVRGWTDGEAFEVHGALQLESVGLLGQQITRLESPIDIDHGTARLESLSGNLLGGALTGKLSVSLDATPRYAAELDVRGADLQQYAFSLQGPQSFRGKLDARLALNGFGGDLRRLHGTGQARVVNGDLGELPVYLRLLKVLTLAPANKTAFDSADVVLTIQNGKTYFDPIRFTGNAFSLHGRGTMDVQGALDMRLSVVYGRDRMHVKLFSDALREASGQFLVVRITGTPSYPKFKLEPLPELSDGVKSAIQGKAERERDRAGPRR
jgi:hypothetical protein